VAQSTRLKAVHLTQLRTAVAAARTAAALGAFPFTDALAPGVRAKAVHLSELRTALDAARLVLGVPAMTYTHTLTPTVTKIYALDVTELRNGVK
jgi:hypothetical protein